MSRRQFFWLHIKKSAGMTTRSLLRPYYVEVDRAKKPKTFIQALPEEYNDIINNYRVVLGEYQFKRCLFAKKYLYPGKWDDVFSFAFSREPTDRCVSMFYYLFWNDLGPLGNSLRSVKKTFQKRHFTNYNVKYAFDLFLDRVQEARCSDSIYIPLGNHFTTHTAPMWDDVTDFDGNLLLSQVYRTEDLVEGINLVFEECGISKRLHINNTQINKNIKRKPYIPTRDQKLKIEKIYSNDFDIYENAGIRF